MGIDPSGCLFGIIAVASWMTYLVYALIAATTVASVVLIESETHIIGNAINDIAESIQNVLTESDNGRRHSKSGGGRDSGFQGLPNEELENLPEEAKRAGNAALSQRIIRELKNRGWRNRQKNRKGPHMRSRPYY